MIYFLNWVVAHISPFLAFALGVWISVHMRLGSLAPKTVWLMAIPVGLLTIGNFMNITYVDTPAISQNTPYPETADPQFTYMKTPGNFLVFVGTLVFYGTAVPKLFDSYRQRITGDNQAAVSSTQPLDPSGKSK